MDDTTNNKSVKESDESATPAKVDSVNDDVSEQNVEHSTNDDVVDKQLKNDDDVIDGSSSQQAVIESPTSGDGDASDKVVVETSSDHEKSDNKDVTTSSHGDAPENDSRDQNDDEINGVTDKNVTDDKIKHVTDDKIDDVTDKNVTGDRISHVTDDKIDDVTDKNITDDKINHVTDDKIDGVINKNVTDDKIDDGTLVNAKPMSENAENIKSETGIEQPGVEEGLRRRVKHREDSTDDQPARVEGEEIYELYEIRSRYSWLILIILGISTFIFYSWAGYYFWTVLVTRDGDQPRCRNEPASVFHNENKNLYRS